MRVGAAAAAATSQGCSSYKAREGGFLAVTVARDFKVSYDKVLHL